MRPLIELHDASLVLGGETVLDRLRWRLMPGEHWAVIGRNGAGKTLLLRLLRGEVPPYVPEPGGHPAVTWAIMGEPDPSPLAVRPVSSMLSPELQRHYMRQGWRLSGAEVILSGFGDGYMRYDRPSPEEREAICALADRLGATHLLNILAPEMSQGQLRLILLARALVKKPRLLLLDEPFDGLDAAAQKSLFSILEEIAGETSMVCAIHKGEDLPACLTHFLELEEGKIVRSGPLERAGLFATLPSPAPEPPRPQAAGAPPSSVLRLSHADVYLQGKKILHGLNWEVKTGENWLLSGPNGSGKTTLLRVLLGEEHVALGGSLTWFGQDAPATLEERRRYIGYVSDWLRNSYQYDLTGRELVLSGLMGSIGFYRRPTPDEEREAEYWLNRLNLTPLAEKRLDGMSEGVSRRFLLARALAPRPKLLILDEPCSGLDGEARAEFMRLVPSALEGGSQLIFVSHSRADLSGIRQVITHELRLNQGRIEYSGIFQA